MRRRRDEEAEKHQRNGNTENWEICRYRKTYTANGDRDGREMDTDTAQRGSVFAMARFPT